MSIPLFPSLTFQSSPLNGDSASNLPAGGTFVLVTDQLDAPAEFILHRALASQLKSTTNASAHASGTCTLVSTSADLNHWKAIASRSNLSLPTYIASKKLSFIDASNAVLEQESEPMPLRRVYDSIVKSIPPASSGSGPHMVILDDVSSFEWIGIPYAEINGLIRAVRSLCVKSNASLIILNHILSQEMPTPFLRDLLALSHVIIDIHPLSSGRSGAVSGEITVRAGPLSRNPNAVQRIAKKRALQYRLSDGGAIFFHKGTGGGIL